MLSQSSFWMKEKKKEEDLHYMNLTSLFLNDKNRNANKMFFFV